MYKVAYLYSSVDTGTKQPTYIFLNIILTDTSSSAYLIIIICSFSFVFISFPCLKNAVFTNPLTQHCIRPPLSAAPSRHNAEATRETNLPLPPSSIDITPPRLTKTQVCVFFPSRALRRSCLKTLFLTICTRPPLSTEPSSDNAEAARDTNLRLSPSSVNITPQRLTKTSDNDEATKETKLPLSPFYIDSTPPCLTKTPEMR